MNSVINSVYVNISFPMLKDPYYISRFISAKGNPEIYFDANTLDTASASDYKAVASVLEQHHLSVTFHGPFVDMSPGSPDDSIRESTLRRFDQIADLIDIFHPKSVVFHAGYDRKRYAFVKKIWTENSIRTWSLIGKKIQASGSRLMLENVFEESPDEMIFLCDALKQYNSGFCLDIGHLTVFGKSAAEEWLSVIGPYIGHLHLHDNNKTNDDHLGLGKGSIDFKPLFDFLKTRKDDLPVITLEPHDESHLLPSIGYLNTFFRI